MSEQKAPDTFVKAAKLIKEEIPNAYFILVGDGELRNQIKKMIHEDGLDSSFLITGWVDSPASYMKIMNVGTLLSRWEGFGLVLPEYMACGVPIVATNIDAIPNIIQNNENGILVRKNNFEAVSKAVNELFDESSLIRQLINNAEQIVNEKYNAIRLTHESIQMYLRLLND